MGNCLVPQGKVIKIMKLDGKILEYKPPLQVHQVLSEFTGQAIADTLPVSRHLPSHATMKGGQLYFLLPLPHDRDLKASDELDDGSHGGKRVVRIKLVVTKQELREMLSEGGVSVDEILSKLGKRPTAPDAAADDQGSEKYRGWKPILESIPEGTDLS